VPISGYGLYAPGTTFQREETRTVSVFKERIPEARDDEDDKVGVARET
jgi:hypothetical protein